MGETPEMHIRPRGVTEEIKQDRQKGETGEKDQQ
jgi:hypothetical protein